MLTESFSSPITANLIAKLALRPNKLIFSEGKLLGLESRPSEGGIQVIVDYLADGQKLLNNNVRSKVHEYGGGDFNFIDGEIVFVDSNNQQVYLASLDNQIIQLTNQPDFRFADFTKYKDYIICVAENHNEKPVQNLLVAFRSNSKGSFKVKQLIDNFDFVSNPIISPNQEMLAFVAWNHPHMPWENSELWLGDIKDNLTITNLRKIAGGSLTKFESVFQPMWSSKNELFWVSDQTGFGNLYVLPKPDDLSNEVIRLTNLNEDINQAQWVFGLSAYAFINSHTLIFTSVNQGLSQLYQLEWQNNFGQINLRKIDNDFTSISCLTGSNNEVYMYAASSCGFLSIQKYSARQAKFETIKSFAPIKLSPKNISLPQSLKVKDENNNDIHAFFYPALNKNTNNPLIVKIHGGPTSFSTNALNLTVQFWTNQGFSYLDLNYRGSFGYGKEYQLKLNGNWGVYDVHDAITVCQHLIKAGLVDSSRIAITGSSAGGLTALNAIISSKLFAACSVAYGVSDLTSLAKITHKFESHYLDSLIGHLPGAQDKYDNLSPINNFNYINCPVIFFQGDEDMVVPASQTTQMYEALKAKKLNVQLVIFSGEGHGFRKLENIEKLIITEYNFLVQALNLPYELIKA